MALFSMLVLLLFYVIPSVLSASSKGTQMTTLKPETCTKRAEFSLILTEITAKGQSRLHDLNNSTKIVRRSEDLRQGKKNAESNKAKAKKKEEDARISNLKEKACVLMEQAMYATQELIWPTEPLFKKFEKQPAYRMAYIFNMMEQSVKDARAIIKTIERRRTDPNSNFRLTNPTRRLHYYWQLVKRHADLTFMIDFLRERIPLGTEGVDTEAPTTKKEETEETTTEEDYTDPDTGEDNTGGGSGGE